MKLCVKRKMIRSAFFAFLFVASSVSLRSADAPNEIPGPTYTPYEIPGTNKTLLVAPRAGFWFLFGAGAVGGILAGALTVPGHPEVSTLKLVGNMAGGVLTGATVGSLIALDIDQAKIVERR